jgi:hypothetical protein
MRVSPWRLWAALKASLLAASMRGDGGVEFAGGDLFGGGVDVAELAGGEVGFAVRRRASAWVDRRCGRGWGGARRGRRCRCRVEHGAGFVVGELFEEDGGFFVFGIRCHRCVGSPGSRPPGNQGSRRVRDFGDTLRMRANFSGSVWVREARPSRRRAASCARWGRRRCSIGCSRGGRQGVEPLRRVAEARAAVDDLDEGGQRGFSGGRVG